MWHCQKDLLTEPSLTLRQSDATARRAQRQHQPLVAVAPQQPNEIGSLLLRRSIDRGRTFEAAQTLYTSGPSAGGIDFFTVVHDAADGTENGTVWLILQRI